MARARPSVSGMPPEPSGAGRSRVARYGLEGPIVMYVGNLEPYQGIDLLLQSFARVLERTGHAHLVIIGGAARDIEAYRDECRRLGIAGRVHFLGPRPIGELAAHLAEADVVVSPRLRGNNTPMKLYSYLHSGRALVATDLPTHTQLVDRGVAMLAASSPGPFADALERVIRDEALRARLGAAGRRLVEERFTYRVFRERLNGLLDWLESRTVRSPA
jgi:glycosyltransferase involved in cell wall biosynthesis